MTVLLFLKTIVLFLHFSLSRSNIINQYNIKLMVNFLKQNEVYFVNFHKCSSTKDTINDLKELHNNNIRTNLYFGSIFNNSQEDKYYFHHRFAFVTNTNCDEWNVFVEEELSHSKYHIQKHGLIFCNSYNQFNTIKNILIKIDFKLNSNVFIAIKTDTFYDVYEVHNVLPSSERIFTKCGIYSNGVLRNFKLTRYQKRRDFGNVHLKVAFVVTKPTKNPEEYLIDQRTKHFDTSSKVNYGVFHHTVDIHNFRYTIVPTPGWFSSTRQGTEAGLGYVISKNLVHISGSSGLMTIGRSEAFDFLVGTFLFRTCFLYKNLGVYKIVYDEFIKPFSLTCWLCTLGFIVVLTIFFLVTQFIENRNSKIKENESENIYWVLLNILSAFCQQGIDVKSKSITTRSILFVLLVFTYLWYNYYTSSIVSSLINHKQESFKDADELIKSNLEIGIEDIAFKRILNATNHPTLIRLQNLANKNDSKVNFYPQEEGIAKIQSVGFAYFAEAITAYSYIAKKFTNDETCSLDELQTENPTMLYLVGEKRGSFNELLSVTYRRFVQHGLIARQNKIFCDVKPECLTTTRFFQVGIEQAAPAFIILTFGCILSIVIFAFEIIICKTSKIHIKT